MKKKFDFRKVIDRHHTNCAKWDEMDEKHGMEGLIQLGVADMDFQAPPAIRQAFSKKRKPINFLKELHR